MRIKSQDKVSNWEQILDENIQVEYVDIPTGKFHEITKDDRISKSYETEKHIALGFQTESGRGKGVQWVPIEHVEPVLDILQHFVDNQDEIDSDFGPSWPDPVETIKETIRRIPRYDADGSIIPGAFDINFRVRPGKGSKAMSVPAEDFPAFVAKLRSYQPGIIEAVETLETRRAEREERPVSRISLS